DAIQKDCDVPAETVFFHYEGKPSNADAVRYTAPSGGTVFSSGSLQFVGGLDPYPGTPDHGDPRLQQFMRNALNDLSGGPTSTSPPTIAGTLAQGQTLIAVEGAWQHAPTAFAYQWRRCDSAGASCADIAGATARTYVAAAADVGQTLAAAVTASNS